MVPETLPPSTELYWETINRLGDWSLGDRTFQQVLQFLTARRARFLWTASIHQPFLQELSKVFTSVGQTQASYILPFRVIKCAHMYLTHPLILPACGQDQVPQTMEYTVNAKRVEEIMNFKCVSNFHGIQMYLTVPAQAVELFSFRSIGSKERRILGWRWKRLRTSNEVFANILSTASSSSWQVDLTSAWKKMSSILKTSKGHQR